MNKQQYNTGRVYLLQSGGKNKLGYVPSTGKTTERSEEDKRKKAKFGILENVGKNIADYVRSDKFYDDTLEDNFKKYKKYQTIKEGIGFGTNLLGSIGSMLINNRTLDKLKAPNAPMPKRASKMLTSIDVNPQLDRVRESTNAMQEDIDNNTLSSKVALNRKNKINSVGVGQYNQIQGQKVNIEAQLINTDRQNQQNINNANVDAYNAWDEKKTAFENAVKEKRSENIVGHLTNINSTIQNQIGRLDKKENELNTIKAMVASNPNMNPRILASIGIPVDPKLIRNWDRVYGKKKII